MGDASFSALVESWLEAVKPGLGVHASVIFKYGATSEDDMASLDKRDISALEELFAKAGVAPLQVRRIADRMPSMIDAIRTAMHTPAGKPAPAGAAATSSTAEDWRRRKRAQQEGTESDEDDDFVDDDSDFDEEEPGEDGGEEAGEDGGEEVEEDAVRRPQPANTTSRSRARNGGARRQAKGAGCGGSQGQGADPEHVRPEQRTKRQLSWPRRPGERRLRLGGPRESLFQLRHRRARPRRLLHEAVRH
jgi:hypothetical protein